MMTDITRLTLHVFVEGMGVPMAEVISAEWGPWYEEIVQRLVMANGDALDVISPAMPSYDRAVVLRAAMIVRQLIRSTMPEDEPCAM